MARMKWCEFLHMVTKQIYNDLSLGLTLTLTLTSTLTLTLTSTLTLTLTLTLTFTFDHKPLSLPAFVTVVSSELMVDVVAPKVAMVRNLEICS